MDEQKVLELTGFVFEVYHVEKKHSPHKHDHYEFFYQLNGDSTQKVNNCMYNVEKGDFILIPPNTVHETDVSGTRILLQVSNKFLHEYFTPKSADLLMKAFRNTHIRPEKESHDKIHALLFLMKKMYVDNDERLFELFTELMNYLSDAPILNKVETGIADRIKSICTYVNTYYAEIDGTRTIAKEFYLSESYFCRSFKQIMNMSFSHYLTKVKLEHAAEMLINKKDSISAIAETCGFHSLAYFCNVFKKEYGLSPYRYKQGFELK